MKEIVATLSVERELNDELLIIEYQKGNGRLHFHSQMEICIVEEGCVDVLINKAKKSLKRGDVALCLSYNAHSYSIQEDARYCVLLLPSDVCGNVYKILQTQTLSTPFIIDPKNKELFMEYLGYIKDEHTNDFTKLGYVYQILGLMKEEFYEICATDSSDSRLLSSLLLYIHKNYNKNLTLNSIAKAFGYHAGYISTYFKSHLLIGISRYINIIRLKNAVLLMQERKHTITQIAIECGFSSTRTFYRAFNSEFGCSPREYLSKMN